MKHYCKQMISNFKQITGNLFVCLTKEKTKTQKQQLVVYNLKICHEKAVLKL